MNIFENLCYRDERHPDYKETAQGDDENIQRIENCSCDNCFYGRDKMAQDHIRTLITLLRLAHSIENIEDEIGAYENAIAILKEAGA